MALLAGQVGAWRMLGAEAEQGAAQAQVERFLGAQQVRGLVSEDPAPRGRTTSLRLSEVLARSGAEWVPLGASVLVNVPHWPEHEYGEYLQLSGRLQRLSGGSAIEALERQGVLASMSYPRVSYLANPQANSLLVGLAQLRGRLGDVISQTLPEPEASTLKATILGLHGALSKDEQQALVDTGTVHLIVISGFKLTLVAAALEYLGLWLLRRITAGWPARLLVSGGVLAAIAAYTLLTGATPSAVRAAIMAGLVSVAALAGRPRDQVASLAIAVLAIVAVRPFELFDAGLQLSSLSVLGIALLAQPLATRLAQSLGWLPGTALGGLVHEAGTALAQAAAASTAATLFVLPVLASSFHVVSLVSPLTNLLGMPLLAPIMALGGLGAALGAVWLPSGALLLWPAWAFTALLETLVRWSAALPHAAMQIDGMPPLATALYYAALLAFTAWARRPVPAIVRQPLSKRRMSWAMLPAAALALVGLVAWSTRPPATLRATLLAVPGQAALLQTPSGRKVLIDGGEDGAELTGQLGQILPPWDRSLDLVLITSGRTDHIGGLDDVFARYQVLAVIEPDVTQSTATFRRLQASTPRVPAESVDLGGGATLSHVQDGWMVSQGAISLLIGERTYDVQAAGDVKRFAANLRGAAVPEDAASLADTGNVTVSFELH